MRIYSILGSWAKAHHECEIPEPSGYFKNKKMCEHCIKGQCIMTWIFGWFLIFTISLGTFGIYRLVTYESPPEPVPMETKSKVPEPVTGVEQ